MRKRRSFRSSRFPVVPRLAFHQRRLAVDFHRAFADNASRRRISSRLCAS